MNVYISVDMEGITGIVHGDMMGAEGREYDRGRRLMTGDASAAVEGAVRAGADYILVADGHGPMRNIFFEELHPAAHLMTGSANARDYCQLQGADSRTFDAALFVGYHAMAQTYDAVHPHTIAGVAVHELRVNGKAHGETGLNAAILGALGIPVVLVTGDLTTTGEARAFLGDQIETVAVKEACGRNAAICRPLKAAQDDITAAAERALARLDDAKVYAPGEPLRIEVDFLTMQQCDRAARTAGIERVSPITVAVQGDGAWEQYRNLWAGLRSSLYEPASWLA
ncbi:MAG: M55 family metallopeptidase [Thermomicrobiales bacterium]|nr:M55 family metallopeptidase [Thermomicrobiales bacterium]